MRNLPIMFFHRGNQSYLKYVIEQAEKWNDDVWLLGDDSNREFAHNWIDSSKLESELFERFLTRYEHMSTRPYEAEIFCFESHFRYYEMAKKMGWQKFLTMDSDVLVYQTLSEDIFEGVESACGWTKYDDKGTEGNCDPFVSYWTINAMEEYLNFCVDVYISKKEELKAKWNYHLENRINGGVCDMTLLTMWKKVTARKVMDIAQEKNGQTFDISVESSNNEFRNEYKMSVLRKVKKIKFINGIPYLYKQNGNRVRTCVLHCNGHNKKCIKYFQNCVNIGIPYILINWCSAVKIKIKHTLRRLKQNINKIQKVEG